MPVVRLFAQAREAAGTSRTTIDGATVAEVLDGAKARFGPAFTDLLPTCGIWVNGEPADPADPVTGSDELAVLPPVSGGAVGTPRTRTGSTAKGSGTGTSTSRKASSNGASRGTRAAKPAARSGADATKKAAASSKAKGKQTSPAAAPSGVDRFLPRPHTDGPKVRMGVLWFLVALAAATAGRWATGALWAVLSAAGAAELVRVWRAATRRPGRQETGLPAVAAAALGAALVSLAAAAGTGLAGLALVVVSAGSYLVSQSLRRDGDAASEVVVATVFPAVVAASVVLVVRTELWSGLFLLLAVSLYDAGSYLMGAEARSRMEGPVAGIVGALAVTFTMSAFQPPPFGTATAWLVGSLVAFACPLGQAATSLVLPSATVRAPAIRRMDAYVLSAPVMLGATWLLS